MKIDILTFPRAVNRGAHMQCYALQKVLSDMGHEVEVILIELPPSRMSFKGRVDKAILNWKNRRFRSKYYLSTTRAYHSAEELRSNPPVADVYIVGSDQVWNSSITGRFGAESFFLDFAPKGVKKIAYAASFGSSFWVSAGTEKDEKISQLIKQFVAISVREINGVDICKQTFGVDCAVSVIDPVFLLSDYSCIVGRAEPTNNNVICYPLCVNDATKGVFVQTAQDIGGTPVSFNRAIRGNGIHVKMFSSIPYWLKSLMKAKFIVTNSFHCMAFCIIFHKNFIVTPPHKDRESRMVSILQQLGIGERYVSSLKDFASRKHSLYKDIDYSSVSDKLKSLRLASLNFLRTNL